MMQALLGFLERAWGQYSPTGMRILYGNTIEFGDAKGSIRKRCLFFFTVVCTLKSDCLVIGLIDRQSTLSSEVSSVLSFAHENPKESVMFAFARTHNRIRSPRSAASGQ